MIENMGFTREDLEQPILKGEITVYSAIEDPSIIICDIDNPIWENADLDCFPLNHDFVEVKLITVTDLSLMIDHRRILELIFMKLDFRMLLVCLTVSKYFNSLATSEMIRRRNRLDIVSETDVVEFWSDVYSWFIGSRCPGFDYYERTSPILSANGTIMSIVNDRAPIHHLTIYDKNQLLKELMLRGVGQNNIIHRVIHCGKWEEITIFGECRLCRRCTKLKSNLNHSEEIAYRGIIKAYGLAQQKERVEKFKEQERLSNKSKSNIKIHSTDPPSKPNRFLPKNA